MQNCWSFQTSAKVAASMSAIAFVALVITFPVLLSDIAQMEIELALHSSEFQTMSNVLWEDLMQESRGLRSDLSLQRSRRQCKLF